MAGEGTVFEHDQFKPDADARVQVFEFSRVFHMKGHSHGTHVGLAVATADSPVGDEHSAGGGVEREDDAVHWPDPGVQAGWEQGKSDEWQQRAHIRQML